MQNGGWTGPVLAWLLTYAVHSTALLTLAALLTWRLVRAEAWRDALWQAALLGGLVTASLQQVAGVEPLGGVLDVGVPAAQEIVPPRGAASSPGWDASLAGHLPRRAIPTDAYARTQHGRSASLRRSRRAGR